MQIVISVPRLRREVEVKGWKKPFKKLKLSKVRAEKEWCILLDVNEKELEKIHSLLDGRFQTETVLEPDGENETWDGKTAHLGVNVDEVA